MACEALRAIRPIAPGCKGATGRAWWAAHRAGVTVTYASRLALALDSKALRMDLAAGKSVQTAEFEAINHRNGVVEGWRQMSDSVAMERLAR